MKNISWMQSKPVEHYKGLRINADTGLHGQIADLIQLHQPSGAGVLDFGAGPGALSERLKDLGYEVHSVDVDEAGFGGTTAFEKLDFNDAQAVEAFIKRNEESFDIVLGIEVIEHVENPWNYVRDIARMIRPGGCLVLSPNITSWYSRVRFLLHGRFHQFEDGDREYGHINPIAEDELHLILEGCGLEVLEIAPGGWLPRLWLSWRLGTLLKNLFGFVLSFVMKGTWRGWCLIAVARKPSG